MNRKRYEKLKALAKASKVGKLNVHSVFRQDEVRVRCPGCDEVICLSLENLERSSAAFLSPKKD